MGDFDYDLLVVNGVVVTDASCGELDIAVLNGKIQAVVARGSLQPGRAKRTIDAQGAFVTVNALSISNITTCVQTPLTVDIYSQEGLIRMCILPYAPKVSLVSVFSLFHADTGSRNLS